MSPDMHDDLDNLHDDLAGYALGALDRDEADRLEAHLEGCDSCRERLSWLYPAVDTLPASIAQISPPDSLRESLMATVIAEAEGATAAPAETSRETASRPTRRSRWATLGGLALRPAAGFAVVILLAAGIATGYLVRGSSDEASPSTFVEAKPAQGATGVSATLERHGDSGTLHVNQLPALDRDEVYEVWVQRAGVMEPASTFILGRDGSAEAAVPGPLAGAEAVLITAEPPVRRAASRPPRPCSKLRSASRASAGPSISSPAPCRPATATPTARPPSPARVGARPICPDCMTSTPVGMRCPECARERTRVRPRAPAATRRRSPYVTYALIALNVVGLPRSCSPARGADPLGGGGTVTVSTAICATGSGTAASAGPTTPVVVTEGGELYRLVTGAFLHGGIIHLGLNMLVLFILGAPARARHRRRPPGGDLLRLAPRGLVRGAAARSRSAHGRRLGWDLRLDGGGLPDRPPARGLDELASNEVGVFVVINLV